MKVWKLILILILIFVLAAGVLAGCGGSDASSGGDSSSAGETANVAQALTEDAATETYSSAALDTSYEGALPASSQLALGTLELAETANAVTPEQAATLLPLWQAIQAGALQSEAETNAVLKQLETAMTAEQLAAVAAMQLTFEDMGAWMQARGVEFSPPQAAAGGQAPFGRPGDMSEEERAAMRATAQAGGGMPGSGAGPFGDVSEEERAAMRATAEASGMTIGNRGGGAGRGQLNLLAQQVVDLLTRVAAE
jgi:hypothetical protein